MEIELGEPRLNTNWIGHGIVARIQRFARSRSGSAAAVQTLAVNLLIIAINAATGIITARALGAGGRGQYAAMIMWPQFLALTLSLGLPSALIFHAKRNPARARAFYSASLGLGLLLSLAAAAVGFLLIPIWMAQYPGEAVRFAQCTMLLMPVALWTEISIAAFRAREQFAAYNRLRLLTPVLTLVGLLVLLGVGAMTPLVAAVVNLAACTLVGAWFTLHHTRTWRPRWKDVSRFSGRLLPYGLRAWGNDLLVNLSLQADGLLVVGLLSPDQLGIYTAALSLSRMLNVFQTAVVSVLLPRITARPVEEAMQATGRALGASTVLAVAVGIVVSVFAEPLLRLFYGAEFTIAIPVFRLLVIETILGCATMILLQPFLALGRPGLVSVLQGAGLALSLPLLLVLIPRYGLLGAGLALLIASWCKLFLTLIGYPIVFRRMPPVLMI
jgi:O-antigen/teichoic acid export membrane protein